MIKNLRVSALLMAGLLGSTTGCGNSGQPLIEAPKDKLPPPPGAAGAKDGVMRSEPGAIAAPKPIATP
jgi:hypothetical protein